MSRALSRRAEGFKRAGELFANGINTCISIVALMPLLARMKPTTETKAVTFRLEQSLVDAMRELKERDGISATEQVRRALREWLGRRGIKVGAPTRRFSGVSGKRGG